MDLQQLIDGLSRPEAYPDSVANVSVIHTHISVVFVAGEHVYKIKKPVNFGFLDFSTLEKRKHFCEEEVRLNRRLAAHVYEGTVPIVLKDGRLQWSGAGEAIEWGVKMQRLPDDARLSAHLKRGTIKNEHLIELAQVLATFHREASGGVDAEQYGRFSTVAQNAHENFTQARKQIGITISEQVFQRLQQLTETALRQHQPLIEERAQRGITRETHGDLHLNHIYFFPDISATALPATSNANAKTSAGQSSATNARWVIIDCIEFNERFRFADPMADLAFLLMDLRFQGFHQEASSLARAYAQASGDREGLDLLPFYTAYRAAVRGKVEGFELLEKEIPAEEKSAALARSRAHWLLSYQLLAPASETPKLILIGGLPGTGKTTIAQTLARDMNLEVIRSDLVRKELAAIQPPPIKSPLSEGGKEDWQQGLYSEEMTERTYKECLRRAEAILFAGGRVIVDANFRKEWQRQLFFAAFSRWALTPVLLWCEASEAAIRQRLAARTSDASDANWEIYQQAKATLEPFSPSSKNWIHYTQTD